MSGYSTIVDGTIVSPSRFNYDITTNASSTIPALLTAKGLTDKVGLQFVIYNNSASPIGLTATSISNYLSYPKASTSTIFTLNANQSVTFITVSIGSTYEISASSVQFNIEGGFAGNLIYQNGTSTTAFAGAGTGGNVLSNIIGVPTWQPFYVPNLALTPAGSVDYQSAPSTTTTTLAGTQFTAAGGSLLGFNTAPQWSNLAFIGSTNTYSGGTFNIKAPRTYTLSASTANVNPIALNDWLSDLGIPDIDGNDYVIQNNTSSTFLLVLPNYQNGATLSKSFFNSTTNQINLYPDESVEVQTYSAINHAYTVISTTQSQGWMSFGTNASLTWVANSDVNISYNTGSQDPNGWIVTKNGATNSAIQPTVAGYYLCTLTLSTVYSENVFNYSNKNVNIQIRKNNTQVAIGGNGIYPTLSIWEIPIYVSCVVYLNGTTDYVNTTAFESGPNPFIYANGTNFSVVLLN